MLFGQSSKLRELKAIEYALIHLLLNTYPGGICWLRARDEDIGLQILEFAIAKLRLKLPEDLDFLKKVDFCWSHWHDGDVLVVLDDVNDYSKVEQYLPPQSPRFKLLITTRLQLDFPQSFTLDVLSESAALELLQEWVGAEKVAQELEDAKDAEQLEDSRVELESLHLLQGEDSYQLHQLIREFFQLKQAEFNQVEELKRSLCRVMIAIANQIPQDPTLKQITDVTPAIPHIAEVANHLIQYISNEDLILSFCGLGRFYEGQGLYSQAVLWFEQCLEVTKKRLGEEHPYFASSLNNLAELYRSQGRYSKAEPLFSQALELWRRLRGEEHLDVATGLNNLAFIYLEQGKYSEAKPLFLQALELWRRLRGEEHIDVATGLKNLALLYNYQGRYSEAEPLYLQALKLERRLLGEEHLNVTGSLNSLANVYLYQGKYSKAEPLFIQALEIYERRLGINHLHTVSCRENLAILRDRLPPPQ